MTTIRKKLFGALTRFAATVLTKVFMRGSDAAAPDDRSPPPRSPFPTRERQLPFPFPTRERQLPFPFPRARSLVASRSGRAPRDASARVSELASLGVATTRAFQR